MHVQKGTKELPPVYRRRGFQKKLTEGLQQPIYKQRGLEDASAQPITQKPLISKN